MDDLSKRLRNASPHRRGGSLPPSAETLLRDITSGGRTPRSTVPAGGSTGSSSRARTWTPILSAAGALMVAFLVVIVVIVDRPAAVAATPHPLAVEHTVWTLSSLRKEVAMTDSEAPSPTSKLGTSYQGWYLQMDEESERSLIQPQRVVSEPGPDGSGVTVVLAGEPVSRDGKLISPLPKDAVSPGTLQSETSWTVEEYSATFPTSPPGTAEEMRTYLEDYLRRQGAEVQSPVAAGDYLLAAVTLLQTWTLDTAAQRALVDVLLNAPGIGVLGGTTDRVGRAGVVLDIEPGTLGNPAFREHLVIDPTTWHVLAAESITVDPIPEYNVPAGAVTSYTLWNER